MGITTFLRQHSLKLAIAFALFGLLCWLGCLSPVSISFGHLQKVVIYLGLEILYDVLRHWCLKLVKMGCDRLRHISRFVDDLFVIIISFKATISNLYDFQNTSLNILHKLPPRKLTQTFS